MGNHPSTLSQINKKMPLVNLTFCVENIPATETLPFQLSVQTTTGDHVVVIRNEPITSMEKFTAQQISVSDKNNVRVRILIAQRQVDSTQSFNVEKEGPFILIRREEGKGLQVVQRKLDDKFGTQQVVSTSVGASYSTTPSSGRAGFVVDPRTGEKKYSSSTGGVQSPRVGATTTSTTSSTSGSTTSSSVSKDDVYEQLEKLGQLRDRGILTNEEFAAEKKKLLNL